MTARTMMQAASLLTGSTRGWWFIAGLLFLLCVVLAVRLASLYGIQEARPALNFAPASVHERDAELVLYPADSSTPVRDNIERARLSAVLLGVVTAGSRASASLSIDGSPVAVYKAGDTLRQGVTLESIEPARVVIREQGARRYLPLEALAEGAADLTAPPPAAQENGSTGLDVGVSTVVTDDGQPGLKVDRIGDGLEAPVDIVEGDVIVAVAGRPLTDFLGDPGALAQLTARERLAVTLIRNGVDTEIEVGGDIVRALMNR